MLPDGYTGWVTILFGQPDGKRVKYEEGKRVYRIPESGVLKLKTNLNDGWQSPEDKEYLYVADDSSRKKLLEVPTGRDGELPEGVPAVFFRKVLGKMEGVPNSNGGLIYAVGTQAEKDSLADRYEEEVDEAFSPR